MNAPKNHDPLFVARIGVILHSELSGSEKLLLIALATTSSTKQQPMSQLARKAGVSVRQVRKKLRSLEEAGHIKVTRISGYSSFYEINWSSLTGFSIIQGGVQ